MPAFPDYTSNTTLSGATGALDRSTAPMHDRSNPDDFGGQIGQAESGLGAGLIGDAREVDEAYLAQQAKKRAVDVSSAVAQTDFASAALDVQKNAPVDGANLPEDTRETLLNTTNDNVDRWFANDKDGANAYRMKMQDEIPHYVSQAAVNQKNMADSWATSQLNSSLDATDNKVRADRTYFDLAVSQGNAAIDASTVLPDADKASLKKANAYKLANSRFEGALEAAKTPDDVTNLQSELMTGPDSAQWQSRILPPQYQELLLKMDSTKRTMQSAASAQADVALQSAESRINDPKEPPISAAEMAGLQSLATSTGNGALQLRIAQAARDNSTKQSTLGASPTTLRSMAAQAAGGPGNAYPGLPAEVSGWTNQATQFFPGVSAAYLGETATREYGQNFPKSAPVGNPKFAPVEGSDHTGLGGVNQQVVNGLTVAGQVLGEPLTVTSGLRDAQHNKDVGGAGGSQHLTGNAVDLSVAGKSPAQQAQMVDALMQAGFTGFGMEGDHIHADMRGTFATWTDKAGLSISPETQAIFDKRGATPGVAAAQIDRSGPASAIMQQAQQAPIDYSKNANGDNSPTAANGLMQFKPATWMTIANQPGTQAIVKQATGVDMSGMSDSEKLALRGNGHVSLIMGAALAQQDKSALETALNRPVSDAELYMAHFLGAAGATSFIKNMASNPTMPAATALPAEALANPGVFYPNKGKDTEHPLSVQQVYNNIVSSFSATPNQVGAHDSKFLGKLAEQRTKELAANPIGVAQDLGTQTVVPLDQPGGWQARGVTFQQNGNYYQIPDGDNKPFNSETEVPNLTKQIKDGTSEQVLALLQQMGTMDKTGPGAFKAGVKQLGLEGSAYSAAADLATQTTPDTASAATIIRGQKRLEADPSVKQQYLEPEGNKTAAFDAFNNTVGTSLNNMSPASRDAIRQAANAHYVETAASGGSAAGQFDPALYAKSVQTVIGANAAGGTRVANVNGAQTVMPQGVPPDQFNKAVDKLNDADLTSLSVTPQGKPSGLAPVYSDGTPVTAMTLTTQGKFRYVGGDVYKVQMSDGTFLITANSPAAGQATPYLIKMNAPAVSQIAARPDTQTDARNHVPAFNLPEAQQLDKHTGLPIAKFGGQAALPAPLGAATARGPGEPGGRTWPVRQWDLQ